MAVTMEPMPAGESANHVRLKALARAWARANGFPICASEVRVPRSGFRADVAEAIALAAIRALDLATGPGGPAVGRTNQ